MIPPMLFTPPISVPPISPPSCVSIVTPHPPLPTSLPSQVNRAMDSSAADDADCRRIEENG